MAKITQDVIESYLACQYKAFLKLTDQVASSEILKSLLDSDSSPACAPVDVNQQHVKIRAAHSSELTSCSLSKGTTQIYGGLVETDLISLHIEGLQRVAGSSGIGNFHYLPCVTENRAKANDTQRVLLSVTAYVLSSLQGRAPDNGIIWRDGGKYTLVQLASYIKRGEHVLNTLKEMQRGGYTPMLTLNKHCQVCEYQSRCYAQAIEEDNLSLLRGISEAEVGRLRKKGVFTINQLSYTFRPRRVKKRAKNPVHPHYFALQARALREKKVFVHGSPKLNMESVCIYMDFEGTPSNQSYYLIGLLVTHPSGIDQRSFWADGDDGEVRIFLEMLDYIKTYKYYTIFHYGVYEARALKRVQKRLPLDYGDQIKDVLNHMVNVLSVVGPHVYFPVFSN
jgi:predicted RecB family nuclease